MSSPAKPPRRYDAKRRRRAATARRTETLDAADELFSEGGYSATSIQAIADRAGVSARTVYLAFETKSGLLRALWNLRLRGDDEPVPVGQRPWYVAVLAEPDPEAKLRSYVKGANRVRSRIGGVLRVVRDAAPADTEIAALWGRIQTEFLENQREIVKSLHRQNALRPGLSVSAATDVLWTLNHPTVFLLLVHERDWTMSRYERWLTDALCLQLLAPAGAETGA